LKILVQGKKVYDGTGAPPIETDILIENGIIIDLAPNLRAHGSMGNDTIVISGPFVCPGFIDIHRHADTAVFTRRDFGRTELLQGITTTVVGNCGLAPVPGDHPFQDENLRYIEPVTGPAAQGLPLANYHAYRTGLEALPLPVNIGFLAAAGAITTAIKGFHKQGFTPETMNRAQAYIKEALDAGALGLSFGIMYQPQCYSSHEEFTALAAAASGTILCTHIRGEGDSLVDSVQEIIHIAERANIPAHISHFKATGTANWRNRIFTAIERIEAARARGLDITADFYPYDGGSTTIMSLVPPSLLQDSNTALFAALIGKEGRETLRSEIAKTHSGWDNMALSIGWDRIIINAVSLPDHEAYCGRNMEAIARKEGFDDPTDLMGELLCSEKGKVGIIPLSMDQQDIDTVAKLPWTCLISDSLYSAASKPHPRLNGAFPKFLREYVRERHIITMEEAIKKMTSMPAERMGLRNRGKIAKNYAADIVVFDPDQFTDNASYTNPTELATGMDTVILNGKIVYNKGNFYHPNGCFICRSSYGCL
jgi:N-acyl-D-aspartate/D-glutamate deacylase